MMDWPADFEHYQDSVIAEKKALTARITELQDDRKAIIEAQSKEVAENLRLCKRIAELEEEVRSLEGFKMMLIAESANKRYRDAIVDVLAQERHSAMIHGEVVDVIEVSDIEALRGEGGDAV